MHDRRFTTGIKEVMECWRNQPLSNFRSTEDLITHLNLVRNALNGLKSDAGALRTQQNQCREKFKCCNRYCAVRATLVCTLNRSTLYNQRQSLPCLMNHREDRNEIDQLENKRKLAPDQLTCDDPMRDTSDRNQCSRLDILGCTVLFPVSFKS